MFFFFHSFSHPKKDGQFASLPIIPSVFFSFFLSWYRWPKETNDKQDDLPIKKCDLPYGGFIIHFNGIFRYKPFLDTPIYGNPHR